MLIVALTDGNYGLATLTTAGTLQLTGYSGDGILAQSVRTEWMGGLLFSDANFDFTCGPTE